MNESFKSPSDTSRSPNRSPKSPRSPKSNKNKSKSIRNANASPLSSLNKHPIVGDTQALEQKLRAIYNLPKDIQQRRAKANFKRHSLLKQLADDINLEAESNAYFNQVINKNDTERTSFGHLPSIAESVPKAKKAKIPKLHINTHDAGNSTFDDRAW